MITQNRILARAKSTKSHKWFIGFLFLSKGEWYIQYTSKSKSTKQDISQKIAVDIETSGQFTEVYDKTNRPIFENDIVNIWKNNKVIEKQIIGYSNQSFVIKNKRLLDFDFNTYSLEIIGNIHDNPELLERKTLSKALTKNLQKKQCIAIKKQQYTLSKNN